jgi:hypothetical protein
MIKEDKIKGSGKLISIIGMIVCILITLIFNTIYFINHNLEIMPIEQQESLLRMVIIGILAPTSPIIINKTINNITNLVKEIKGNNNEV